MSFAALEAHLKQVLAGVEPVNFDAAVPMHKGGPRPLDRVSAYRRDGHWLYVTYGITELHAKKSKRADRSGWGFELTFRLASTDAKPPRWPTDLLQGLASFVYATRNPFTPGAQMDLNGPIQGGVGTQLTAALFDNDAELGEVATPHGGMRYLQLIPVTADEAEAAAAWSAQGLLSLLPRVADLGRASLLADPATAARIAQATTLEGSSTGTQSVEGLSWRRDAQGARLVVGAFAVESIRKMLAGRTLHARPFALEGPGHLVVVEPAAEARCTEDGKTLKLQLTSALARAMQADLKPRKGTYRWDALKAFTLQVEPTEIVDPEGKTVRRVG